MDLRQVGVCLKRNQQMLEARHLRTQHILSSVRITMLTVALTLSRFKIRRSYPVPWPRSWITHINDPWHRRPGLPFYLFWRSCPSIAVGVLLSRVKGRVHGVSTAGSFLHLAGSCFALLMWELKVRLCTWRLWAGFPGGQSSLPCFMQQPAGL